MADHPDTPYDPRLGPRSPREQAEQVERDRRARDRAPLDEEERRSLEATGGLLVVTVVAVVAGLIVGIGGGAPVAGLYVTLGLFGALALVVLVHPETGTHPDLPRRPVVVLCTLVGVAAVGLLAHLVVGGAFSLPFALLLGAPLGAAVGWLLGTALVAVVRGLRRLGGR